MYVYIYIYMHFPMVFPWFSYGSSYGFPSYALGPRLHRVMLRLAHLRSHRHPPRPGENPYQHMGLIWVYN